VPALPAVRAWRAPLTIALVVVAVDQLTKHWAVTSLGTDREIHLFWTLQFNLGFNNGMAFGQGQGFGPVIAVVATLVIVYLLVTLRTESSRMSTIGIGLLIGGAAGNLIDRIFRSDDGFLRGAVVDFIDFQWFPIFNVADMAINVGAGLLILNSVLSARAEHRRAADDSEPERTEHRAGGGVGEGPG
jgi:signal peptidase II